MKCGKRAMMRVWWVGGQELLLCPQHYEKALAISNTIGGIVRQEPLFEVTLECTQEVKDETPRK